MIDPGALPYPNLVRGSSMALRRDPGVVDSGDVAEIEQNFQDHSAYLAERNFTKTWLYFWARRKGVDSAAMKQAKHYEMCPTCKLCRCGQAHGAFMFRCCCSRGMKMFGPNVFRELHPGASKPYVIRS